MSREPKTTVNYRERQISDAAQECGITGNLHDLDCFVAGAEWSDSHPCWHRYPDETPSREAEYFVACCNGDCTIDKFIIEKGAKGRFWRMQNLCRCDDDNVEFWMEKPRHPKFD